MGGNKICQKNLSDAISVLMLLHPKRVGYKPETITLKAIFLP